MGLGPIVSTKKALRHAGITVDQIDRIEINEAFACQVIITLKELGIPEAIGMSTVGRWVSDIQ